MSGTKRARVEQLRELLESRVSHHRQEKTFIAGGRELAGFNLGYPAQEELLRVAAAAKQHAAWLYLHGGCPTASLSEAAKSVQLLRFASSGSLSPSDCERVFESCLIAAHAALVLDHSRSKRYLALAAKAARRARVVNRRDLFREQGIWWTLVGRRREAQDCFDRAFAELSEEKRTLRDRHRWVLSPDAGRARDVLKQIALAKGTDSLDYSVNLHWRAACELMIDDEGAIDRARSLIAENGATARRFPDQAILARVLDLVCDLELSPGSRRAFLIWALYYHAARRC